MRGGGIGRNLGETDDQHQQHDEGWELVCDDWHHHTGTTAGSKCDKLKDFCEERLHLHGQEAEHLKSECYAGNSKFSVAPLWSQQTEGGSRTPGTNQSLRGVILDFGSPAAAATEEYWQTVSEDLASGGVRAVLLLLLLLQLVAGAGRAYSLVFSNNRDTGSRLTMVNLASVSLACAICAMSMLSDQASPVVLLGPLLSFLIIVSVGATTRQPKDESSDNKWFALVSGRGSP